MSSTLGSPPKRHEHLLRGMAHRLEGEFGHLLTLQTLQHYVDDVYQELASDATVLNFIPAFVERFTRERLRALSKMTGPVTRSRPDVLFVCERSDGCSQMAAAIFNSQIDGRAHARSAGSRLGSELAADVDAVLAEIGISAPRHQAPIRAEVEAAADVIITLDTYDDIPVLADKHYEAWKTKPAFSGDRESFRRLRDDLGGRIQDLIDRVIPDGIIDERTRVSELS